jgi:PAS domain S-box-containing protein
MSMNSTSLIVRYGVAIGVVACTAALAGLFDPLSRAAPTLLVGAVVVAAWYGGLGPGLLATGLAVAALDSFFVSHNDSGHVGVDDVVRLTVFALVALLISSLEAQRRRAAAEMSEANRELERRVRDRTNELSKVNSALRKSGERRRLLVERNLAAIFRSTVDGRILECNDAFVRTFGYASQTEVLEQRADVFYPDPADRQKALALLQKQGSLSNFETRLRRKDGSLIWILENVSQLQLPDGVTILEGTLIDITDRKAAEEAIQASEKRFRGLFENTLAGVVHSRADGQILDCNDAHARLLGYSSREELVGGSAWNFYLSRADREALLTQLQSQPALPNVELRLRRRDGRPLWVLGNVSLLEPGPNPIVQGIYIDITERKRAEEEVQRRQQQLAEAQRLARLGSWEWDIAANKVRWSHELYCIYGLDAKEFPATFEGFLERVHPDDRGRAAETIHAALRTSQPFVFEERIVRPDGSVRSLYCQGRVQADDAGKPILMTGVCQDITDRKRADEALRESEGRYRALFEAAFEGIAFHEKGAIVDVNGAFERMFGRPRAELIGKPVLELGAPETRHIVEQHMREGFEGWYEAKGQRKDGTTFWGELSTKEVEYEGRPCRVVVIRDVSERKRVEEALRASEERLRFFVDQMPAIVYSMDRDLRITLALGSGLADLGIRPNQLVGTTLQDYVQAHDPSFLPLAVHYHALNGQTISREGEWQGRTYQIHVQPLRNSEGVIIGCLGIAIDVSERRRAEEERRQFEAQMQHAQKLESLGVLAGGIAHDFNNLLTGVLGNASLALLDLPPDSPARVPLRQIETAARRAGELTKQMLAYSGRGRFQVQPVDLSRIIDEMAGLLQTVISKKAALEFDFAPDLPAVMADATQVRQVVMNLITNASEALGDNSGVVTLRTGVMNASRAYLTGTHVPCDLPEGAYVFLEVSDTGAGIDAATMSRIFDPFFSTKFTGRGLGLAAVLGIVRGHQGAIKVESQLGRGTTFKVLFPCTSDAAGDDSGQPTAPERWRGSGTVLVVEDEVTVRQVAQQVLEYAGFRVLLAADGREGIDLFRRHCQEIAAVLLDLTMPHVSGEEAYRELRLIRPDVRVILMSGYTEQEVNTLFAGKGLAGFVQKPFHVADLLGTLRRVLERATSG